MSFSKRYAIGLDNYKGKESLSRQGGVGLERVVIILMVGILEGVLSKSLKHLWKIQHIVVLQDL